MPFSKQIEVRWRDMDAFSHVNNAAYLTYLEEARDEWLYGLVGIERGKAFLLARVAIDYRSPVTQDDDAVAVTVELVKLGRSSVVTRELVTVLHDGRIAVEAESVLVQVDGTTGSAAPIGDDVRAALLAD